MKWIKILTAAFVLLAGVSLYLLWPVILPKNPNEELHITLQDGSLTKQFKIKRGYLRSNAIEPVQGLIVLNVDYPDMGIPPPWKQGGVSREMQISIASGLNRITQAESITARWKEIGHLPNNGPGFDRYVGLQSGYDVYTTLPNAKTGNVVRTEIFVDHDGNLVSDSEDSRAQARMLGDLVVKYGSSRTRGGDPKQMRVWVENFIRQISDPQLPALPMNITSKTSKE